MCKKIVFLSVFITSLLFGKFDSKSVQNFFSSYSKPYLIVVKKSEYHLWIVDRNLRIIDEAKVAVGKNNDLKPKIYENDQRTPQGLYKIIESIHQDMPPESPEYIRLQKMNKIKFLAKDGYYRWNNPKQDLGTNAFGYGFFRLNYPNQQDKRRYLIALRKKDIPLKDKNSLEFIKMGDGIAIHGTNDPDSIGHAISSGCIRVKNEDLRRMVSFFKKGSYVLIEP